MATTTTPRRTGTPVASSKSKPHVDSTQVVSTKGGKRKPKPPQYVSSATLSHDLASLESQIARMNANNASNERLSVSAIEAADAAKNAEASGSGTTTSSGGLLSSLTSGGWLMWVAIAGAGVGAWYLWKHRGGAK